MGTYRSPQIIQDPLADALSKSADKVNQAAVNYIASAENQKRLRKRREDALNKDLYNLDLSVNSVPSTNSDVFDEAMKTELKRNLDEIHRLGMDALRTGDSSEYYRKRAMFEGVVKKLPSELSVMNKEAGVAKEGANGRLLNNQDSRLLDVYDDWNNNSGANLKPTIENGNLVINYGGPKDEKYKNNYRVVPGSIVASVESGGGISLLQDPTKELETVFKAAAGNNYDTLAQGKQLIKKGDKTSYNKKKKDYSLANQITKANLTGVDENGNPIANWTDPLQPEYNQNNWQHYMGNNAGIFTGDESQKAVLRERMVSDMMNRFGLPDEVTTFTATTVDETTDTSKTEIFTTSQKAEINTRQKDYVKDFNEVKNIASLETDIARKQALVKAANSRTGTKRPVLKYENGKIFKITGTEGSPSLTEVDINVGTGGYYEMQNLLNDSRPKPISSEIMGYFRNQQLGTKTSGKGLTSKPTQEVENNNDPAGLGI